MRFLILVAQLVNLCFAFQIPFEIPFFRSKGHALIEEQSTPRIAIVGAGAAGSSAAFWISKAKERYGLGVEVDIYERSSYVGGRSTTVYPYDNRSLPPIELGASIFIKPQKNMWRATDEFNLTRRSLETDSTSLGVWDGSKFLLTLDGSMLDTAKVVWRYGPFAPYRADQIVKDMVRTFSRFYKADSPRWDNISALASEMGWDDRLAQSTSEYFENHGVSRSYTREMIEAATRVNYGQNVDRIHALEGACSMAPNGAVAVEGGNWQIFDQFIRRSGANLFFNTSVQSILPKSDSSRIWTVRSDTGSVDYKGVIIAAPFHSTTIELPPNLASQIPPQPYVPLHVTLLTTTSPTPDPEYFGFRPGTQVPTTILTTYEGVRNGGNEPEFNSLSYHGHVLHTQDGESEWVAKIFSKERISDEWLSRMFRGQVGWVHRKKWDAYPYLPPTTTFPPVRIEQGLYYVNAFEPFISTMGTQTIASRNVVDLLLNEEFGTGICGSRLSASEIVKEEENNADFVLGWDC